MARRLSLVGLVAILLAMSSVGRAEVQVVSAVPDSVSVTVYRDSSLGETDGDEDEDASGGLLFVTETRTIELPAGASTISFLGVADGIAPQTVKIDGLSGKVVEYNFDDDLLSPASLMARSVGQSARLVRTDSRTGRSTEQPVIIRAGPNGVVLQTADGFEALQCSGASERLIFDSTPPGLTDKPTLSVRARAAVAGRYRVQVSYLALGLDWSADYVARIRPGGRTLDLSGWITLVNHSNTSFTEAQTAVVAGSLSRVDEADSVDHPDRPSLAPACWPVSVDWSARRAELVVAQMRAVPAPSPLMIDSSVAEVVVTGERKAKLSELADYKLYTLPERTTMLARQTKQVQLLSHQAVPFERIYGYRVDTGDLPEPESPGPVTVLLRLQNRKGDGLGSPLPAGKIAVTEPGPQGFPVFAGAAHLADTPVGLPFEVELGRAMDVWVQPRMTDSETFTRGDVRRERLSIEVMLANDKPVPIRFELRQAGAKDGFRVVSESSRHRLKSGDPLWSFTLRPGERRQLRYVIEQAIF